MKRIKWYIGLDKLDALRNNFVGRDPDAILYKTRRELIEAYGGFTETRVNGGWMNPQSKQISLEPTVIFEVVIDNYNGLYGGAFLRAEVYKKRFDQESVLFTVEALDYAKFVV